MDHHKKIHHLFYNLLRGMFSLMGHDIFRGGIFKPTLHTNFMYTYYVTFYVGVVKTLMLFDLKLTLQILAFLGMAVQVLNRFQYFFLLFERDSR